MNVRLRQGFVAAVLAAFTPLVLPLDFDARLNQLEGCVAFDLTKVQLEET